MDKQILFCPNCDQVIIEKTQHDPSHTLLEIDSFYSQLENNKKTALSDVKHNEISTEFLHNELKDLFEIISRKKTFLSKSLKTIIFLEENARKAQEISINAYSEIEEIKAEYQKNPEKPINPLIKYKPEGLSDLITNIQNKIREISTDSNLYKIGETLVLNIMLESAHLRLEKLTHLNENNEKQISNIQALSKNDVNLQEKLDKINLTLSNMNKSISDISNMQKMPKISTNKSESAEIIPVPDRKFSNDAERLVKENIQLKKLVETQKKELENNSSLIEKLKQANKNMILKEIKKEGESETDILKAQNSELEKRIKILEDKEKILVAEIETQNKFKIDSKSTNDKLTEDHKRKLDVLLKNIEKLTLDNKALEAALIQIKNEKSQPGRNKELEQYRKKVCLVIDSVITNAKSKKANVAITPSLNEYKSYLDSIIISLSQIVDTKDKETINLSKNSSRNAILLQYKTHNPEKKLIVGTPSHEPKIDPTLCCDCQKNKPYKSSHGYIQCYDCKGFLCKTCCDYVFRCKECNNISCMKCYKHHTCARSVTSRQKTYIASNTSKYS